jgi:serine/threonine protein kinase
MKVVGTPSDEQLYFVSNQKARRFVKNLPRYEPVDLLTAYPKSNHDAVDLLTKMLSLDPTTRLSCEECLNHEFFKDVRDIECCETVEDVPIDWGNIETCELTKRNLQELLIEDFNALEKDNEISTNRLRERVKR